VSRTKAGLPATVLPPARRADDAVILYVHGGAVDPLLTESPLRTAPAQYLHGADARDPLASPLHGDLAGLPPVQINVGDALRAPDGNA